MGQSMMISFGCWCFQFIPSWGAGEHLVLGCFRRIWDWNVGQRWVEQKKQIYISKKSEESSVKKIHTKHRKRWKSALVCFCPSLFINLYLFSWFSFLVNSRLLQQMFLKLLYDRTLLIQGMHSRSWRWW